MKTILVLLFFAATFCAAAQDTTIIKLEYFIDVDPGVGSATSLTIPAAGDVTFPFTVNATGYSNGYHELYLRTRDNFGRWSLTARRTFEVLPLNTKSDIISGEYFIDTDPGFGAASPITVSTLDTLLLQNFTAVTAGFNEGYHKLYGRFKDNYGNWSQTFRRSIELIRSPDNKVLNGEYFFRTDNGFGNCAPVAFTKPSADGTFSFNIPNNQIPENADTLFIRVRDDIENKWSLTQWIDSLSQNTLPLALLNFDVLKQNATAQLIWKTTDEINTAYFNVQRSTDGRSFKTIGKVNAKGRSNANNSYLFNDKLTETQTGKVYYRLQMTDIDGRFTYSNIRYITIDIDGNSISIYPNPAHSYFVIANHGSANAGNASVIVRDATARIMVIQKLNNSAEQRINIASLSKGIYVISIVTPNRSQAYKLLVQ